MRVEDAEGSPNDSLVRALRPRTPDVTIRQRTAEMLHDAEIGNRELVGVLAGAEEAVFYSSRTRCVAAVTLTDVGPNLGAARPLGQAVGDAEAAFDRVDAQFAWTNPRLDD
jgi:hypothetical protein